MKTRLIGEWKALKDLATTIGNEVKWFGKDCVRIWRDWLDERPHFKCPECSGWAPKIALRADGRCVWCEFGDGGKEAVAEEAWMQGHAQGWLDCEAAGKELQLCLDFDEELPFGGDQQ